MRHRIKYGPAPFLGALLIASLALVGSLRLRDLDAEGPTSLEPSSPEARQLRETAEVGVAPGVSLGGSVEITNSRYRMNAIVGGTVEPVAVTPDDEATHAPTREHQD